MKNITPRPSLVMLLALRDAEIATLHRQLAEMRERIQELEAQTGPPTSSTETKDDNEVRK